MIICLCYLCCNGCGSDSSHKGDGHYDPNQGGYYNNQGGNYNNYNNQGGFNQNQGNQPAHQHIGMDANPSPYFA
jgi:hypothetical protein